MSNTHEVKIQELKQWLSEEDAVYRAKTKSIEKVKWYQRISVVLITVLALVLFSAAYFNTNSKENLNVNELITMSAQFFIMSISIVTVIVTFFGKMFNDNKLDEKHIKQLDEIKKQDDSLSSSIIVIQEQSKIKTKFMIIYMVSVVSIGMISGVLINELITYMHSTFVITILGFALLILSLPFAINVFVKTTILRNEFKKYRLKRKEIIAQIMDESEKHYLKEEVRIETP